MLCEMLGMDEMYTKRLSDPAFKLGAHAVLLVSPDCLMIASCTCCVTMRHAHLGYNGNRLSLADRSLVCLIRGILADPDVLVRLTLDCSKLSSNADYFV